MSFEKTELTGVSLPQHSVQYYDHSHVCVPQGLFLLSFRKEKPSWKEIARNKSRLVTKLLKGYDKRIRPYTGGRKDNLCNKFHCTFDGK